MAHRAKRLRIESDVRALLLMPESSVAARGVSSTVIEQVRTLRTKFVEADLGDVVVTGPLDEIRGWVHYCLVVDVVGKDGRRRLVGDLFFDRVANRICSLENLAWSR
jgi:hypothetical protein